MKKFVLNGLLALALSGAALSAMASPAVPVDLNFKNTDGSSFTGKLKGDEWFSWIEAGNGYVVVRNKLTGSYEYARLKNNDLEPSGIKPTFGSGANAPEQLPADILKADSQTFKQFVKRQPRPQHGASDSPSAPGAAQPAPGDSRDHGPASAWNDLTDPPPTIPLLVVIIEFNDQQLRSPIETWQQKIFGTSYGQMNHFYTTVTGGRFRFTPATESHGTANDGIVSVRLPIAHPNHRQSVGTAERMQALDQLDGFIDFASFDKNGDEILTKEELQVIYLYAGGEASTSSSLPSVWAHKTSDFNHFRDGVELRNNYSRFGERHFSPPNDHDATIGIIAHELGHAAFNLPDLYDYDGSSGGADRFCLMSSGSWGNATVEDLPGATPVPFSAWVRYRLGFSDYTAAQKGTPLEQSLKPLIPSNGKITLVPTDKPEEFFLVENRWPTSYDASLAAFGEGALIWHINEAKYGNDDDSNRLADYENNTGSGQIFWPDGTVNTFGPSSTPNSNSNDGSATGVTVSNLRLLGDADHTLSFRAEHKVSTTYPTMYFRGTANNWGLSPMNAVASNVWEVTQVFAAGVTNPRFKFDVYGDWKTNFGDTNRDGKLEASGGDIAVTTPGTYRIRLDEKTMTYTLTKANQPPIANAGPDQTVSVGQSVTLDGSASSDPDGTIINHVWSNGLTGTKPTTVFDSVGSYTIGLTVTDDQGATATDSVVIKVNPVADNLPPVARIATVGAVTVGKPVTFDGSTSSDADGSIAGYQWTISGVGANLTGPKPTYTFTAAGTYTLTLTVTDNKGVQNSASTSVKVDPAGFKQTYPQVYYRGTTNTWTTSAMTLVGDNSWAIEVSVPATGSHTFKFDIYGDWKTNFGDSNNDGVAESFGGNIAFPAGGGNFRITFNDSTKRYTVVKASGQNQPPTASVPATQSFSGAGTLSLNGSASSDPDGRIVSYLWTQVAGPSVTLSSAAQAVASAALPSVTQTTTYRFRLTVTDDGGASASAEQTVTQTPAQSCTPVYPKMNLRGTTNSWGMTVMNLAGDCFWQVEAQFGNDSNERFKFDVNGDWNINFGDNNLDGIAERTGKDIPVTQGEGTYLIRFNDKTLGYTMIKK